MWEYIANFASALLGAAAAFGGTYLTLRHQSDVAKEQRQFEQKRIEYARFIEAMSRASRDLGRATDLDHTKLESSVGLMEFSESVGRLYLFASPPVLEKAVLLSKDFTAHIGELLSYMIKAMQHNAEREAAGFSIEQLTRQEGHLRQLIEQQELKPFHPTSVEWKAIISALLEQLDKKSEMDRNSWRIKLEAFSSLIRNYKKITPTYVELISAMRSDLSDGEKANVNSALEESWEAGIRHLEDLMKQAEEAVKEANRSSSK